MPASGQAIRREHKDGYNARILATLIFEGEPDQHGLRPRVWLGSESAARNPRWIEENLVGVVQSCTGFALARGQQKHPTAYYPEAIDINEFVLGQADPQMTQLFLHTNGTSDGAFDGNA